MPFDDRQIGRLQGPLHPKHVRSRSQSGRNLSYIEGWHAIAEANEIFGFHAWTRETVEMRKVQETEHKIGQQQNPGWGVSYLARVRITVITEVGESIIREGWGAGHGIDKDLGLAHESASKEAETDAMKRALMTFGNPFGLALYDKEQANVSAIDHDAVTAFVQGVNAAETADSIQQIIDANVELLANLKAEDLAEWRRLSGMVASRRAALAEKEAKE